MNPKEKAREIFDKMYSVEDCSGDYNMTIDTAKQCALIAVDEILNALNWHMFHKPYAQFDYWHEVKTEINKNNKKTLL